MLARRMVCLFIYLQNFIFKCFTATVCLTTAPSDDKTETNSSLNSLVLFNHGLVGIGQAKLAPINNCLILIM